jgi:HTH-type transcriptional regulator, transcriptional repressor of NAD biosynthesis genes
MGLELFDWYGGSSYDTPAWPPEIELRGTTPDDVRTWAQKRVAQKVSELKLERRKAGALVLGRFDPPHVGHAFLLAAARAATEAKLIVCVFSRRGDFLPVSTRANALRELLRHQKATVNEVPVTDDFVTGAPDPKRWAQWFRSTEFQRDVGVLVSSDPNAEAFAKEVGLEFLLVDAARERFPISATTIRADPWASWDAILPPLHPGFARLVGLIGPEGGGKTTVAGALSIHFNTSVGFEYLARIASGVGRTMVPTDVSVDAMQGQLATNFEVRAAARRFGVIDSDVANLKLWYERLFPEHKPFDLKPSDWCHHYLLFDEHPWTGDAAKNQPEQRKRMVHDAVQLLEANGRSFAFIDGPREGRLKKSIDAIEAWVTTKPSLRP